MLPGGFQLWTIAADGRWVWAENSAGRPWLASGHKLLRRAWDGPAPQDFAGGGSVGAIGAGAVWFTTRHGVARIDPNGGQVTGTVAFPEGGPARGVAAAGNQLWAINSVGSVVWIDRTLVPS